MLEKMTESLFAETLLQTRPVEGAVQAEPGGCILDAQCVNDEQRELWKAVSATRAAVHMHQMNGAFLVERYILMRGAK